MSELSQPIYRLELENGTVVFFPCRSYDEAVKFANRHFRKSFVCNEDWQYIDEYLYSENLLPEITLVYME